MARIDIQCPKKNKECKIQALARARKNNFICAGLIEPVIPGDCIRLCVKGKIIKNLVLELTPKEALAICVVLSTASYNAEV